MGPQNGGCYSEVVVSLGLTISELFVCWIKVFCKESLPYKSSTGFVVYILICFHLTLKCTLFSLMKKIPNSKNRKTLVYPS